MNYKERYKTLKESEHLAGVAHSYSSFLDNDVSDFVMMYNQKKDSLQKDIDTVWANSFIKVFIQKNKTGNNTFHYTGKCCREKMNLSSKITYITFDRDPIFVEVPEKIFDRYNQDENAVRRLPGKSANVAEAILLKLKIDAKDVVNTPLFFGKCVKNLAKEIGYDNATVYNFKDYDTGAVNAKKDVKVNTSIDDEKLFYVGDSKLASANEILGSKTHKPVIFITRYKELYHSDLNKSPISMGSSHFAADVYEDLHKVFGDKVDGYWSINYGDWKRMQKKSAVLAKLPIWDTYIGKLTTAKELQKQYSNCFASIYKEIPSFLRSTSAIEEIEEYTKTNHFTETYEMLESVKKARIDDFLEDFKICKAASKFNIYTENRKRRRLNWISKAVFNNELDAPKETSVNTGLDSKYPFFKYLDSYEIKSCSSGTGVGTLFNIIASFDKSF